MPQQSRSVRKAERRVIVPAAKVAMATNGMAQANRVEPTRTEVNRTAGQGRVNWRAVRRPELIFWVMEVSNQKNGG
jgi:hypothetical protein